MDQGTVQGIGTIFAMLAFASVCWWAYSGHKKKDFEEAANLPFEGDELAAANERKKEQDRQEEL